MYHPCPLPWHTTILPFHSHLFCAGDSHSPRSGTDADSESPPPDTKVPQLSADELKKVQGELFTRNTRALIYGYQPQACQNMLDFDFLCGRKEPSVAGFIYAFDSNRFHRFYWNQKEILIPSYQNIADAMSKFPEVDTVVNFSSFRSVHESMQEIFKFKQVCMPPVHPRQSCIGKWEPPRCEHLFIIFCHFLFLTRDASDQNCRHHCGGRARAPYQRDHQAGARRQGHADWPCYRGTEGVIVVVW